ncbi:PadR family transcriptional regulator [Xylanimonas ulmi]|uniref:PadR family transcriptional regulator n=1 Tax=Xylanimonas ulmi TaxID=228973 RepID=A0A4V2EXN1_9MICO|nr:PadR family transcriptional regulator [Xylanibacterium ulmi]RZS60070.1 PadR family transcriptional regulator [Xylanibacterium ulmi]
MPPVFAHGELRLYLLALLEDGPRHGYELMTALSERFGGTYRPSAGTVYPRLARMEEEGLVRRDDAGRTAPYVLTEAGRALLDERRGDLRRLEHSVAETVRARADELRADVSAAMRGLRAELAAAAQEVRARPAPDVPPDPRRAQSYAARREVEALVQGFRADVLADLRRADVEGAISALTVETARTVLDGARAAIRATVRP